MGKPNILFVFADQQRHDTCGCYGQRLDVTPRLDAFAKEGVLFENAFTCQPVCGPARAALQSGRWPQELGCFRNCLGLPEGTPTVATAMNGVGYQTAYCGKWHLATIEGKYDYETKAIPPERRGGYRDFWVASDVLEFTSHSYDGHMFRADGSLYPIEKYRADAVTDAALEFLEEARDPERPFFLFVSYIEPHHQNDHHRFEGPHGSKERFADYDTPGDLEGTAGDWRENYPDYLGCCNAIDRNFGRMLDSLKKQGLLENTLVVYTADHGSHFCTRNTEYKRSCHDDCTHIPLVIGGPGFGGGRRDARLVSLLDLPITLLTAAGAAPLPMMAGQPLQETAPDWPDSVYMQISESHVGRAIRTERWKYAVGAPGARGWEDDHADEYMETYLYDLQTDPFEKHNLVRDPAHREVRAALREKLLNHMRAAGEPPATIRPMTDAAADRAYMDSIEQLRPYR